MSPLSSECTALLGLCYSMLWFGKCLQAHDWPTNHLIFQFISGLTLLFCYHNFPWCFLSPKRQACTTVSSALDLFAMSFPVMNSSLYSQTIQYPPFHLKALSFESPQALVLLQIRIWLLNQFSSRIPCQRNGIHSSRFLYLVYYIWPQLLKYLISELLFLTEASWAQTKPNFPLLGLYHDMFNLRGSPLEEVFFGWASINLNTSTETI